MADPALSFLRSAAVTRSAQGLVRRARALIGQEARRRPVAGTVTLLLDDHRWRAEDAEGEMLAESPPRPAPPEPPPGTSPLIVQAREAAAALVTRSQIRGADLRLIVADPQIEIADNRWLQMAVADPDAVRKYGRSLLGVDAVGFAQVSFGQSSPRELERRVYAFAAVTWLRSLLGALGPVVRQVVEIRPRLLEALAALPQGEDDAAMALLQVDAWNSTLLLADPGTGAIAWRTAPVGFATLGRVVAEANGVTLAEALAGLATRMRLPRFGVDGAARARALTGSGRALLAHIERLDRLVADGITHFSHHRIAARPDHLLVTGGETVRDLLPWLTDVTGLSVEPGRRRVPQGRNARQMSGLNLLAGTSGELLQIGKVRFSFEGGRLRPIGQKTDALAVGTLDVKPVPDRPPTLPERLRAAFRHPVTQAAMLPPLLVLLQFLALFLPSSEGVRLGALNARAAAEGAELASLALAPHRVHTQIAPVALGPATDRLFAALDEAAWLERVTWAAPTQIEPGWRIAGAIVASHPEPLAVIEAMRRRLSDALGPLVLEAGARDGTEGAFRFTFRPGASADPAGAGVPGGVAGAAATAGTDGPAWVNHTPSPPP